MIVLTVQLIWTVLPVAILTYIRTPLSHLVKKNVRRSSEVLLSVSEVAVSPLMLLVNQRTEGCLIAKQHELFQTQLSL